MTRLLFDTNIVLDVLLDRQPHVEASAALWRVVESGRADGLLAAHAVTTIHYLVRKELGTSRAKTILAAVLRVFEVAVVDGPVINAALGLSATDFEDAVTAAAAHACGCDYVVTRDPKGFTGSLVRALPPEAIAPLFSGS